MVRVATDQQVISIVMKSADVAEVTVDGKMTRIRNNALPIGLHLLDQNVPQAARVTTQAVNGRDFFGRAKEYLYPANKFITQNGRKAADKLLKESTL